jgi:hypothetical protein
MNCLANDRCGIDYLNQYSGILELMHHIPMETHQDRDG